MQTVIPGEDGRQRVNREIRENAVAEDEIARRSAEATPSEAERVAMSEMNARSRRMPHDYAAILKYRAVAPGLFVYLPTDEECRKALGIQGFANIFEQPNPVPEDPEPTAEVPARATLKLRK